MQTQILNHQAERLRNVRNAMARSFVENNDHLIRALFQSWVNDTEQSKRRNVGERELDKAQAHFFHVKASRVASSRKIVAQMILDAELAPLVMCLQAWTQFVEEEAKEKAAEERVQAVERQLQEVMVVRKQRVVKVIETMLRKQEEDFQFELFQCWVQQCQEDGREGKFERALGWLSNTLRLCRATKVLEARLRFRTAGDVVRTAALWLRACDGSSFSSQVAETTETPAETELLVASLDEVKAENVTRPLRARRRPAAPVMSKRTGLQHAPSLEYLESCLREGHFDLLLVFAGKEALDRGFVKPEEVPQISVDELRRVDQLWVSLSDGRFGYSIQREELDSTSDLKAFMARIGWLQVDSHGQDLLRYWPRRDFDYSLNAPRGHLPLTNLIRGRDLLLSLLQHPAFAAGTQEIPPEELRPSANEANEEEVRDWFTKLLGGADAEDQVSDPTDTNISTSPSRPSATENERPSSYEERGAGDVRFRITMITGFETFNARLYRAAARRGSLSICVFTDQDIAERREVRMIFESALELMSCTQVGSFAMGGGGGGMPPQIRSMISALTGQREEDRIAGYTKFLKTGPKLLQFLPQFGPIPDLRRWLQTYAFWSGGGNSNIAKMIRYVAREFGQFDASFDDLVDEEIKGDEVPPVIEIPQVGLLHPSLKYPFQPGPFFETPKEYLDWYRTYKPEAFERGWPVVAVLLYRKHVVSELSYIFQLVNSLEESHQIIPVPIFIQGVDAHIAVRDQLTSRFEKVAVLRGEVPENRTLSPDAIEVVSRPDWERQGDAIVNTIGFPLVGGPAGSMEGGRNSEIAKEILSSLNVPYFVAAPLLIQDLQSWKDQGIGGLQGVVLYALPELDGAIDAVALGGLSSGGDIELLPDRVNRLAQRIKSWVQLRKKPPAERKVAIVLYGYPPGIGATGTAALLNVPKSLYRLLEAMKDAGYDVGDLPQDPEKLIREITIGDQAAETGQGYASSEETTKGFAAVEAQDLAEWLPKESQEAVEGKWGEGLISSGIRTMGSQLLLGGRRQNNVWLAVQPPLGIPGDPMRLLFERDMTPHPQYVAFYKYIENASWRCFQALQSEVAKEHGTAEWLPGRPLGNSKSCNLVLCWPDQLLGPLPNVYLYAANNPSESILAKRRGYGCLVSYNVPPYARAGLYKESGKSRRLMERKENEDEEAVLSAGLQKDLPLPKNVQEAAGHAGDDPDAAAAAAAAAFDAAAFKEYAAKLRSRLPEGVIDPWVLQRRHWREMPQNGRVRQSVKEAQEIRELLNRNVEEMSGMLRALNGEYVLPAPGGDLLRDGKNVLPTGRNIHALDPFRIPSATALKRGVKAAQRSIEQYQADHDGAFPETIAVNLWGLEAIKTRGESVAVVLGLIGARPITEGTGPPGKTLEETKSPEGGIFRDSFANVVELLDDALQRAAKLEEPLEMNFVRKHYLELLEEKEDEEAALPLDVSISNLITMLTWSRIFSNAAGEFGSLVNERVVAGNWERDEELGETWASRNAFAFGRTQKGVQRTQVLDKLLSTSGSLLQLTDSVEYGLTDIQEYYANSGAMVRRMSDLQKRQVQALVLDTTQKEVRPRKLDSVLRMEYRTKLLNPKWAEAFTPSPGRY
eukprot:symbB.v1.2.020078.t1/scaffold1661.1/size106951/1